MLRRQDDRPDTIRQQILGAVSDTNRTWRAILFELPDSTRAYRATTWTSGVELPEEPISFRQGSLLIRWLRANNRYLPVPDDHGVYDDLSVEERQQLSQLGIAGCLPFVHDHSLIAWLALAGGISSSFETFVQHLIPQTSTWAARLHDARVAWAERVKIDSVARSNRLTIAGQLAAGIAHEIRNPLAAARSAVQSILDGDAPPSEHRRILLAVLDEVDRMNRTLTRMLTLGREYPSQQARCDLHAISEEAGTFCQPYAQDRDVTIRVSGTPTLVEGDPFELRQVLVNVIMNACQASERGRLVEIDTQLQTIDAPLRAMVRVKDQGSGITSHELLRAFEPFYTTKADGGGLGLSICKSIVERHGGQIELISRVGAGTVVIIQLPSL